MASSELRRRLTELAQQFVDGVIVAIQSVPLRDVAAEIGGSSDGRRLANASVASPSGNATAKRRGRVGAKPVRAVSASDTSPEKTVRSEGRSLVRRPGGEIEKLRAAILRSLKGASGPISASEIARQVGVKTSALAFPMAQLRTQGLVGKDGERTQAVYKLEPRSAATTPASGKDSKSGSRAKRGRKKK